MIRVGSIVQWVLPSIGAVDEDIGVVVEMHTGRPNCGPPYYSVYWFEKKRVYDFHFAENLKILVP